jgi:hypothetical protein
MEPSRNNDRARAAARRKAAMQRRKRQAALQRLCLLLLVVLVILVASIVMLVGSNPVKDKVTLEAGSVVNAYSFLKKETNKSVSLVTDLAELDLNVPGTHTIEISVGGKRYQSKLVIEDTVAPKADALDSTTKQGVLPDPEKLVTNIRDVGTVSVTYRAKPDVSRGGETTADILLTDAAGNTAVVQVKILVVADEVAPVIKGAANRKYYIGDTIAYKEGVTVTDDQTETPILTVDNSAVHPQTPGVYPVIYTARDAAGNEASVKVFFTIEKRPSGYVEPEAAYEYARVILKQIATEDMSKPQIAAAIYNWVKLNIRWDNNSDHKNGWAAGAVYGFTQKKGDCFTYYATAKALLDVAGIPNMDVVKVITPQTSQSNHFWSLVDVGDGWYHMDCTPRANNYADSFFLYTDEEMLAYSRKNKNCFNFDLEAYPQRGTNSVQSHIKFSGNTQKVTITESW